MAAEQFNGRESETASLLSRCLFTLSWRVAGFRPRHLNCWMLGGKFSANENFGNVTI
jgi:hypothetical protein